MTIALTPEWVSAIGGIAVGIGTVFAGIFTYWRKKKMELLNEITLPLLKKYEDLTEANIAVDILNGYPFQFKEFEDERAFKLYHGSISKTELPLVLRDDSWADTSPVEDAVVRSFDALLYFFTEINYIVKLGLLPGDKLDLFRYELDRAVSSPAIRNFIGIHKLQLERLLSDPTVPQPYVDIVGSKEEVNTYTDRLKSAGYCIRDPTTESDGFKSQKDPRKETTL